jgi:negative regulator of sigma E activity
MNDHHTETRRQELSALMDGELSHDRAQFALKGLAEDEAVARQWSRLHLLRHYLREAEVQPVSVNFLAAVRARLDADDDQALPEESESAAWSVAPAAAAGNRFWSGWPQRVAGLAVAASVTMLALFGFNTLVLQPGESMPTATTQLIASNSGDAETADNPGDTAAQGFAPRGNVLQDQFNAKAIPVNFSRDNTDFRQQLNEYMLRHSQLASGSGRIGFTAYAPLLSADVEWSEDAMTSATDSEPLLLNSRMQAPAKPLRTDLE